MFNGVSDLINLNRRRSGIRMTVTLSTALDVSHSPQDSSLPHKWPDTVHRSALSQAVCSPCIRRRDAVAGQDAGSDGRKLIFLS